MISIAIPVHNMNGADFFLRRSLNAIQSQSFTNYEVVVSDDSEDSVLWSVCNEYDLPIHYFRNLKHGMASNTNNAIRESRGKIIKILYLDDYLAHDDSLKEIAEAFKGGWLATGCIHDDGNSLQGEHYPTYNGDIMYGNNTIGSPSVIAIENNNPLLFDESMTWLLDCDYYKRLFDRYGPPTLLNTIGVTIGTGGHQVSNILSHREKQKELQYITNKYENN